MERDHARPSCATRRSRAPRCEKLHGRARPSKSSPSRACRGAAKKSPRRRAPEPIVRPDSGEEPEDGFEGSSRTGSRDPRDVRGPSCRRRSDAPRVMGVLNLTPDSLQRRREVRDRSEQAVAHAVALCRWRLRASEIDRRGRRVSRGPGARVTVLRFDEEWAATGTRCSSPLRESVDGARCPSTRAECRRPRARARRRCRSW